jgi:hypothetical protein
MSCRVVFGLALQTFSCLAVLVLVIGVVLFFCLAVLVLVMGVVLVMFVFMVMVLVLVCCCWWWATNLIVKPWVKKRRSAALSLSLSLSLSRRTMHPISSGLPVCNRQYDSSVFAFGFGFALPCLSLDKLWTKRS